MFRSLNDLDQVVSPAAVGDDFLLFEAKFLERGRIAGICIEIALLQRVKERQLLLRFRRLRTRNQRHQVRQGDQNQYADNYNTTGVPEAKRHEVSDKQGKGYAS